MRAMRVHQPGRIETSPLRSEEIAEPSPAADEILVRVHVCGVCHTDLHIVEGDVAAELPIVPGHQAVGTVTAVGENVDQWKEGDRVGVPWLHRTCGRCGFCRSGRENLCDVARFTGRQVNGGYAEYTIAVDRFAVPIPDAITDDDAAPLLCAGIVGFRALRLALEPQRDGPAPHRSPLADGIRLGLYGFGASAHLAIQVANHWGCEVLVATRSEPHRQLAHDLGAAWVGDATSMPSAALDAAVMYAPAGELVPQALRALRKGGTLALAGIHMSDLPPMDYQRLYHEKVLRSVANATRADARDFMAVAAEIPVRARVERFPLAEANQVLQRMKQSALQAAAVLQVR